MQKVRLPLTLNPLKAAQKRLDYVGIYPAKLVNRLNELVVSVNSDIDTTLSFYLDNQGLVVVKGQSNIDITLVCQRCNQPFISKISVNYCVSPIKHYEQAEVLPESYEPVELNEFSEIDLLSMIEDEIILSLPIVATHALEHCEVSGENLAFGELPPEEDDKPNPFSILANLKQK